MLSAADQIVAKHAAAVASKAKPAKAPKLWESLPKCGLSLRPDQTVMDAYVAGDENATAIIDAWKFHEPIIEVTPEEYAVLIQNQMVTFTF